MNTGATGPYLNQSTITSANNENTEVNKAVS
jgi:hypothetical protein